jgi:outer membrane receptor protein involved in Fe transport
MKEIRLIIFIILLFCSGILSAQKKECEGQFRLAIDMYASGDFDESLRLLNQYQQCLGVKNSNYFKLSSEISIAQDNKTEAKNNIARYINSKTGNYISDDDPQLFKDLFYEVQDSISGRQITSVSKKPEDVDLVAATVLVIKESDFSKRGYLDIIDLLSDQPGFDISRIYSATYANVYQRGFRQENTERTLVMIDGIEENDVWSNIAYLSRQYPLSNISAVEIIYGPASTIYGARAFAGAINIITKTHSEFVKKNSDKFKSNGMSIGATAKALGGSFGTKSADINVSGKNKNISFLLTGRTFFTDGQDLSNTSFYNYDPNDLDKLNYSTEKLQGLSYIDNASTTANELNNIVSKLGLTPGSQFYDYYTGYGTGTLTINPDSLQSLLSKAKKIDKERYLRTVNGSQVGYSNSASNYYFGGKLNFSNFEAGFRTWRTQEGFNYYQDLFAAGTANGSKWTPTNSTFYLNYNKQFDNISFSNSSSYVIDGLDKSSNFVSYNSFYGLLNPNSYSNPTLFNLIFPDSLIDGKKHGWQNTYFYYKARQFRNDLKVNYTRNRLSLLSGLDIRSSQLQGDYLQYKLFAGEQEADQSSVSLAENLGTVSFQEQGGNQYNTIDLGLYSQLTYKVIDSLLYITAGGRYDYNKIRSNGGFGSIFNPKIAAVFTIKKLIIKGIYARGIQNPSQFTKFATGASRNPNPTLKPEKIQNFELVLQNKQMSRFNWNLSGYYSIINDAVASAVDLNNPTKTQNQNVGTYAIMGSQANVVYQPKRRSFNFTFNATYTIAKQTKIKDQANFESKTIADIASFKANFIVNYHKAIRNHDFNINLRSNYVGDKYVGPTTTVPLSTGVNGTNKIPSYVVFFTSLMYQHKKFDFVTIQFTVNNLLNSNYYSPGPRTANGNIINSYNGFVSWVPQQSRNYLLTLNFKLDGRSTK